jgi:hypothetical protein
LVTQAANGVKSGDVGHAATSAKHHSAGNVPGMTAL